MERKRTEINDDDIAVFVRARPETEKLNIDIGYLTERVIPVDQLAHLLASGIGVCIKSCTYNDMGIKDYELVESIVEHITQEFASVRAYNDTEVFETPPKDSDEEE